MRLDRFRERRVQVSALPLASVALLLLALVMVAGMYAAPRGPGLRFAAVERDGGFMEAGAVRVDVVSEDEAIVDGVPVPQTLLAEEVRRRLAGRSQPSVVLRVSSDATYQAMVLAYGAIVGIAPPPRVAFPAAFARTGG